MPPPHKAQVKLLDKVQELEGKLQANSAELDDLRAENRSLREADRKSRAWLEYSPVCTKVLDLEFNLKYMSHAGVSALKLEDAERYYCKPYPLDFFPEFFRDGMRERLEHVRATGEVGYQEAPIITLGGEERWFRSTILPVFDEDGTIESILVVSVDVTDSRKAERHRLELERQMQHAQKLESLGILSAGIAHDFNNLLMSVLGNADLALDVMAEDHPARGNLAEVEKAARRGAELADQMLAYSGRGKFIIKRIGLEAFVAEMAHLLEVARPKKTELVLDFPATLPAIEGDPTQIRQVIMNLITNASEALGEGGGTITLRAGTRTCDRAFLDSTLQNGAGDDALPEGEYVYLQVDDDGCGMDTDTVERIFEPFFTTKFTGRGLGMSAVLGIVRGHHGAILVESKPGEGTSFQVLFPISLAPDGSLEETPPTGTLALPAEEWRTRGTVLIADDEEAVRRVGKEMMEHFGLDVLLAEDGRKTIEVFRELGDRIDCVLLDLTMPELDGEQVFRELKRIHPQVQVILMSGYNLEEIAPRFRDQGLAGFLQKPFDLEALHRSLARVFVPAD